MAVTLNRILVPNLEEVLPLFDVIRIQRSTAGVGGPYTALTAAARTSATLLGSQVGPFAVNNLTFQFRRDGGTTFQVVFTGAALSVDSVVEQINEALNLPEPFAIEESGRVRLRSALEGTRSRIEIVGGTALTELGFTAATVAIGLDPHVPLQAGIDRYTYTDADGLPAYYYRYSLLNSSTGASDTLSDPIPGGSTVAVDAARLSLCVVDLVDQAGRPLANQEISFFMEDVPLAVDGFQVGLGRVQVNMRTNVNGHAELALIRGSSLRVVFVGTSLIRSIVVPDEDTFDLLALVSDAADPFSVVTPNLPSAIRRTI